MQSDEDEAKLLYYGAHGCCPGNDRFIGMETIREDGGRGEYSAATSQGVPRIA